MVINCKLKKRLFMNRSLKKYFLILFMVLFTAGMVGCEQEGPMEKAGKEIDKAAKDVGKATEDAMKDAGKAVEDAKQKVEETIKEQSEK